MFSRSTCSLIRLQSVVSSSLNGAGSLRTTSISLRNGFNRTPLITRAIGHKPAAPTSAVWPCRPMWNKLFGKYLLATNTISSGLLMVIGDFIAQGIEMHDGMQYDWKRLGRMFIVGALQGPLHHYVYGWMDKVMPAQSLKNIGRKILIDQLFMSPACILVFFYSACLLENKSLKETNVELWQKFPYIYLFDWAVWPAAQYINFRYLETKYRVIYVNLLTALYNVFMSYMKHEFKVDNI